MRSTFRLTQLASLLNKVLLQVRSVSNATHNKVDACFDLKVTFEFHANFKSFLTIKKNQFNIILVTGGLKYTQIYIL